MASTSETFEKIYDRHLPRLLNFAIRLCHNREDAEDLTQEAFLRAYRAFDRFHNERPIENWLMRILQNVFFDARRRSRRRLPATNETSLAIDFTLDSIVDPVQDVDRLVAAREAEARVDEALHQVDPDSADLLRLAYLEERPYAELAEMLGVPSPTIRSRLYRSRMKIRSHAKTSAIA